MISKQAALDILDDFQRDIENGIDSYGEHQDMLWNLPDINVGKSEPLEWIPCSEQPPKTGEEVFVYLFGDSPYLAWYDGHEWQTEDFTVDDDDKRPTAWTPLPKPWKGEGDD